MFIVPIDAESLFGAIPVYRTDTGKQLYRDFFHDIPEYTKQAQVDGFAG